VITEFGQGTDKARNLAEQAVSLLKNGRKMEAAAFLRMAQETTPNDPQVRLITDMAELLRGKSGPSLPDIEPEKPSANMPPDQVIQLAANLTQVRKSLDAKANRDALERFEKIPEHLWRRGGPQIMMLKGYIHFLNADPNETEACDESIEILNQLVRDHEVYTSGHPEIFFYLALCHDNALHFDKSVKNMRAYVDLTEKREQQARLVLAQTKANLEARLKGIEGTMAIELPPDAPTAPTTDRQGEAPKEKHQ
jgi:hypothetical protein